MMHTNPLFNPVSVESDFDEKTDFVELNESCEPETAEPQEAQVVEQAPKRRGRPPKVKAQDSGGEYSGAASEAPKRRGRPPKIKEQDSESKDIVVTPSMTKRRGRPAKIKAEKFDNLQTEDSAEIAEVKSAPEESGQSGCVAEEDSKVIEVVSSPGEKAEIVIGGIKINVSSAKIESKNGVTVLQLKTS